MINRLEDMYIRKKNNYKEFKKMFDPFFPKGVNIICLFLIVTYTIFPYFQSSDNFLYIFLFLIFLWFLSSFIWSASFYTYPNLFTFLFYIVVSFFFFSTLISNNYGVFKRFFGLITFLIFQLMLVFYISKYKIVIEYISKYILIIAPFICASSIYFAFQNPYLMRQASKSNILENYRIAQLVGGYHYVYTYVVIISVCLYMLLQKIKIGKKNKIIYTVNLFLGIIMIFLSGFFIALITMCLSIIIILLFQKKSHFLTFAIVFIILLFVVMNSMFLNLIENIFSNTIYMNKINELISSLNTHSLNFSAADIRKYTYEVSLNTIKENPILGCVFKEKIAIGFYGELQIGQHSAVLDMTALFGLFFSSLFFYTLFFQLFYALKKYKKNKVLIYTILISLIIILFLNNDIPFMSLSTGFILYFSLGLLQKRMKERNNNE